MQSFICRTVFSIAYCFIGWGIFMRLNAPTHLSFAFAFFFATLSWTWLTMMGKIEPKRTKTSWLILGVFGILAGLSMTMFPNSAWVASLTTVGVSMGGVFCLWLNKEYAINQDMKDSKCQKTYHCG